MMDPDGTACEKASRYIEGDLEEPLISLASAQRKREMRATRNPPRAQPATGSTTAQRKQYNVCQ